VSAARRLLPLFTAALTSPRTRAARRGLADLRRRLRLRPRQVHYFHQVGDPYGQLVAQTLRAFVERYAVELVPHLVGPPSDEAAPERERLVAYARKDAADVAPHLGLEFRDPGRQPPAALVVRAQRLLAAAPKGLAFSRLAPRVGAAVWSGDEGALSALAAQHPSADSATTWRLVREGDQLRRRLGHYLGATFHYGGEWYWGVDRLDHLEARLAAQGLRRAGAALSPLLVRPSAKASGPRAREVVLEFFLSLRSPYSYLAMERARELARRAGVRLALRPVLPMVMRGLPVPRAKRWYIVLDAKREAERLGIPFGRIQDPAGRGVELGYSLFPWAREQGRAGELLLALARAAFAEGVDLEQEAGVRRAVEAAGLDWEAARARLGSDAWRAEVEANRRDLLALGLWGVPSFRLRGPADAPDFCTWGQDRLWLVEAEIARRSA
jgi:2-hydroxychromene-2-carboxylate isomerase